MKVREMRKMKKTMVAGLAAAMMLAQSITVFACSAEPHDETDCGCTEAGVLYDEQFVDMDGNITPVSGISMQTICPGHRKLEGYYQTHVKDDKGGCVVKTYESTQCVYCFTIWVGDLYAIDRFVKCPHDDMK